MAQVDLPDNGPDERVCQLTGAGGAGPVEPGSQVGPQLGEAGDPFGLGRAGEQLVNVGHLLQAPLRVPPGDQDRVVVGRELFGGELADGLQQPETPTGAVGVDEEHGPIDQVSQQVVDHRDVHPVGGG